MHERITILGGDEMRGGEGDCGVVRLTEAILYSVK